MYHQLIFTLTDFTDAFVICMSSDLEDAIYAKAPGLMSECLPSLLDSIFYDPSISCTGFDIGSLYTAKFLLKQDVYPEDLEDLTIELDSYIITNLEITPTKAEELIQEGIING